MISEFLLKGIDNIFQDKLAMSRPQGRAVFNRDTIKRDLSSVIRTKEVNPQQHSPSPIKRTNIQRNVQAIQQEFQGTPEPEEPQAQMTKSRLKAYLEQDRENKLKSVIRKADVRSRTPTKNVPMVNYAEPYQPQPSPYEARGRPPPGYKYQHQVSYSPTPQQPPAFAYAEPQEPVHQTWQQYRDPHRIPTFPAQYSQPNTSQQEPRRLSPSPNRVARVPYHRMF